MNMGEHLTMEGLNKIVAIKAAMNLGLSPNLKEAFPSIVPAIAPEFVRSGIIDPNWLSGFICAEGCFHVSASKSAASKNGHIVGLIFIISQHSNPGDSYLINKIMDFFKCGTVYSAKGRDSVEFIIHKFSDALNILVPFLSNYALQGSKAAEFLDFKKVLMLMQDKVHLTQDGLTQILNIKNGMNTKRLMSTLTTPAPTIFSQASKLAYVNRHSIFSRMPLEYPLVILFILIGAILLMSSSDLVSMFLAIELQSYGLYIFATLYRNSE